MNPEDPKIAMAPPASSSSPSFGSEHYHHHKPAGVTLPSIHQAHPELSSPAMTASSSSRALHSLYPAATPPMSPAHVLLSPASRPHGYGAGGAGDGMSSSSLSQHSQGFYQLPPPLQTFRPYEHHQHPLQASPTLQPVSSSYPLSHHHSSAFGAQRSPHLHHQSSTGSSNSMSALPPPHMASSPGLGPISPYPTPQHQPISSPKPPASPHQSPRYDRILPKQAAPSHLVLPSAVSTTSATSSLSSSSSLVFPVQSPRAFASAPYPPTSPVAPGASSTSSSRKRSSVSSASSTSTQFKSPSTSANAKSAPPSPVYMMLPPKSAPPIAASSKTKSASISGPSSSSSSYSSSSSSSSASTTTGATAKTASSSPSPSTSKRRSASLSNRSVEQEAREMMRKVSHSAIERRRRERINDKILQLKHLVPACVDEDHLHKLSILQSTIEYVQYLKSCVPEHVANAKFKRASNNDPNNKTTDMLDALTAAASVVTGTPSRNKVSPFSLHKPLAFAPMITTGLNQPFKKARLDRTSGTADRIPPGPLQFHGSHFNTAVAQNRESTRRASSTSTCSPLQSPAHADSRATAVETGARSAMSSASSSTSSSSSDDDAKDGLLMLSQLSAGGPYSSPPESKMTTAKAGQGYRRTQRQSKGKIAKKSARSHQHASASNARLLSMEEEEEEEVEMEREADHDGDEQDIAMREDVQRTENDAGDEDFGCEEGEEEEEEEEGEDADDDDEDDDDYIDESMMSSKALATVVAPAPKRVRRNSEYNHDKPRRSISKMSVDQMLC
ncbi:hypothetical protein DFQ26_001848 [Actinomortierella ambigua]|nr:hypothetical protein DFQ26_001848 [Actinomortierella ambigua]